MQKYGFGDARDVLERASARETAARVAAGACAKALLARIGVAIVSHVVQIGGAEATAGLRPLPGDLATVDASPVRCFDPAAEAAMIAEIRAAAKDGDSLGGTVEVVAYGVPVGLGSHVHWDRKLDGLIAQALMSIQAVKGVWIGDGIEVARRRGSSGHDSIFFDAGSGEYRRETSLAGGIEGGISIGGLLTARAAMKPLATLNRPVLKTVDVVTKQETVSFKERTDVTSVPAMGVVAETMLGTRPGVGGSPEVRGRQCGGADSESRVVSGGRARGKVAERGGERGDGPPVARRKVADTLALPVPGGRPRYGGAECSRVSSRRSARSRVTTAPAGIGSVPRSFSRGSRPATRLP